MGDEKKKEEKPKPKRKESPPPHKRRSKVTCHLCKGKGCSACGYRGWKIIQH